ncbi:unnamed protein product [Paramecium sonneborni]|uniref:Protein kinase domain-containing protein n=1 Tax=Paramecium sonneborni TaxID=65129 RepID=A0A8S1NWS6_9CILI|nr:unnamed protein product [Paramecium sonneborni]
MERCKLNLAEHIADNKQKQQLLSLIEIIDISKQIVNGYHDLYSHHIIHRDLKPENLLIGKDNKIKICDFGFGKIVKYDNQLVAQSILGTPLYVSPQALMTGQYTSKTDVYSFGLILYFLIFQQSYYKAKTFDQLIQNIMVLDKEFSIGEFKNFGSQENITLLQYLLDGCIKFHEKDRFNWDQLFNIFDQISIPQKNRSQSKRIVELRSQSNNRNISQEEQLQMNPYEKLTQHIQIQNQKPPLKEHGMKVQLRALKQNQIIEKGILSLKWNLKLK